MRPRKIAAINPTDMFNFLIVSNASKRVRWDGRNSRHLARFMVLLFYGSPDQKRHTSRRIKSLYDSLLGDLLFIHLHDVEGVWFTPNRVIYTIRDNKKNLQLVTCKEQILDCHVIKNVLYFTMKWQLKKLNFLSIYPDVSGGFLWK